MSDINVVFLLLGVCVGNLMCLGWLQWRVTTFLKRHEKERNRP